MVSDEFGHFSRVPGGYRNPPRKDMGLMGHRREANQPTRGWCDPHKGGGQPRVAHQRGGVLLQVGFGPPFPIPTRRRGKEEEERRKEGAPPSPLVQFGLGKGGPAPPPSRPSLFSTKAHEAQ